MKKPKILIIYTGGTIGMINDPETDMLKPFDFDQITKEVPELMKIKCSLDAVSFKNPIDSSNMSPKIWKKLGDYIWKNYDKYSGFVILHGSDTMAYTASAMSFMFRNLNKPIIFTGSQLPIGTIRTDGKENLITAIEIAATFKNGASLIQEVAIYFEYQLYRANRTTKVSSEDFLLSIVHLPIIIILDDNYSGFQACAADLNFDDFINVMDITEVISVIIGE